jgi:hypothetical protein
MLMPRLEQIGEFEPRQKRFFLITQLIQIISGLQILNPTLAAWPPLVRCA